MKNRKIQKRLLNLVLAAGILSFLTLSSLSFYGMSLAVDEMETLGNGVGRAGANFTQILMEYQQKKTLGDLAKDRADFINSRLNLIRSDVEILSRTMTKIASNPADYKPIKLLDPRFDEVKNFDPYIIYSPETYLDGMTPETLPESLRREIEIASNIGNILRPMSLSFAEYKSSFNVGSREGYFIGVTLYPEVSGALDFQNADIYQYDCRERPWYKNAIDAGAPVFSDLFSNNDATDNYQAISCSAPYYDRDGVAGVVSIGLSTVDIYTAINETAVGANGFSFVLSDKGEVIFSSQKSGSLVATSGGGDLRGSSEETLADAAKKMVAGQSGIIPVTVDGEQYFLAFAPMKNIGWSFATLTLRKEILLAAEVSRSYFLDQIGAFIIRLKEKFFLTTFAALFFLAGFLYFMFSTSKDFSQRLTKPLHILSEGVREITSGNLDKKLDIQTGDEIEHLATAFNAMTDDLKNHMATLTKVTAERERIATELNVATDIQNGMLPKDFPSRADFELLATMTPAKEVGGDFYDFYFLDETHLVITVADVSGKGIPAALFMVISKTILQNFTVSTHNSTSLAEVVAAANDKLCANNEAMMFVTAFIGVLDLETGDFTFVNAGHNPPVVYRAETNRCEFLDVKKNFVLGPMDEIPFVEQKITFKRGDLIFIYTDGVTEALNVAEEEYLPDRLINFMNSTDCAANLETLLKNIRGDVAAHVGDAEQSDD
ncbi:MAG: SpoIIE family protein phosphatase, partial [Selenomonadaceae bacterium]|nr:SpoIIE family protein phosphatase [Selenomonadaceae bacterium]